MALLLLTAATLVMRARRSSLPNLCIVVVLLALAAPAANAQQTYTAVKVQDPDGDGNRDIIINPRGPMVPLYERPHGRSPKRKPFRTLSPLRALQPEADPADEPKDDPWSAPDADPAAATIGQGGVAATTVGGEIQVLGIQISYGVRGPVPVRLESKLVTDTQFAPRFAGNNLAAGGVEQVALGTDTGALVFKAVAAFDADNADGDNDPFTGSDFHREVLSNSANAIVCIDGDNINNLIAQKGVHPPYGSQLPISAILRDYIDPDGRVYLSPNRILILFELGTTNTASAAYDFQDLVIAVDLNGIVAAPDIYLTHPSDQATGSPDSTNPTDTFHGSMVRTAPGASRLRGIAYLRWKFTALQVGTYLINACITQDWSTCNPTTVVYSKPFQDDTLDMADMALTDPTHGLDAIGWVEKGTGNRVTYKVAFSQNNGGSWLAPITLGSYTASSNFPNDIDLAANDDGEIGILTYYRQEAGSNSTDPDSLVLYIYDSSLTQTRKTIAAAAAPAKFATNCESYCFGLTGDSSHTFHAFYHVGSG
ncbi:MAG: hypothetical protein V1790_10685 [Planctomycetota bacterium]